MEKVSEINKRIEENRCVKCGENKSGKYHQLEINKKHFLLCDSCFNNIMQVKPKIGISQREPLPDNILERIQE